LQRSDFAEVRQIDKDEQALRLALSDVNMSDENKDNIIERFGIAKKLDKRMAMTISLLKDKIAESSPDKASEMLARIEDVLID
jgi:hypothetical protein